MALDIKDLRIDTQSWDSAVRVTHLPSGIQETCSDSKLQYENRRQALRNVEARLSEM